MYYIWSKHVDFHQYINSAPDNVRTAVNYGSDCSRYGSIDKTASTEYGRFFAGTVRLFR